MRSAWIASAVIAVAIGGSIKHEPASWKDLFFPEIGGLNGS